jgi:hypothetical protein
MEVVGRRDISRFHSYHVRAELELRSLVFSVGRSTGVLMVFEWDHRLILLEPFQMMHKGNFARSAVFMADTT